MRWLIVAGLLIAPPAVAKPMPTHDTHTVDMRGFTDGMWPSAPKRYKVKRAKIKKKVVSRAARHFRAGHSQRLVTARGGRTLRVGIPTNARPKSPTTIPLPSPRPSHPFAWLAVGNQPIDLEAAPDIRDVVRLPVNIFKAFIEHTTRLTGVDTSRLPKPLRAALTRVQDRCDGFRVTSAYRPGARVAGSGGRSLHAINKAADFRVSKWSCAYAALKGWKGGLSLDPTTVRCGAVQCPHIHISYGGREGRFVHHSTKVRYAKRGHRVRYAGAS